MKVARKSKLQLAKEIASGEPQPCSMADCHETSTHLLIVEAWGDNSIIAIRCCKEHFEFLQCEMAKQPDHLYTRHTTGDKYFGGNDES